MAGVSTRPACARCYESLRQRLEFGVAARNEYFHSRTRALFVGRLIEEKGIFDVVEAFADVVEQTQCHLVIVGEGDQEIELRNRIQRLNLAGPMVCWGPRNVLARADAGAPG